MRCDLWMWTGQFASVKSTWQVCCGGQHRQQLCLCASCLAHRAFAVQVNFFGDESVEEKAAVFDPLRNLNQTLTVRDWAGACLLLLPRCHLSPLLSASIAPHGSTSYDAPHAWFLS